MDIVTTVLVQDIPQMGAWSALLKTHKEFVEGRDGWWDDVDKEEIDQMFVMGILLPHADKYDFYREAVASPGAQPTALSMTFELTIGDVKLVYVFKRSGNGTP